MSDGETAPTEAMMRMLAPDGYYDYLGVPKDRNIGGGNNELGDDSSSQINLDDLVKKAYRKKSIKHHPDKPGGDAETFRILKRAQTVLSNPKLRQQYDILGVDLDDDEVSGPDSTEDKNGEGTTEPQTTSQGIVQEIASMALTSVLQLGVRTVLLGAISLILTRYKVTIFPALAMLMFVTYRVRSVQTSSSLEKLSPCLIGIAIIIMYLSSSGSWNWLLYWVGESLLIFMFTYNSMIDKPLTSNPIYFGGLMIFGIVSALWFRGRFRNYAIVVSFELFLAIFIAVSFPVFEMILEAILNDKLKKVGDKIRAQYKCMELYYKSNAADRKSVV